MAIGENKTEEENKEPSLPEGSSQNKEQLLAAAHAYHELGIPVIPFKLTKKENGEFDKKPYILSWVKWETEAQTDQEFRASCQILHFPS